LPNILAWREVQLDLKYSRKLPH